MPKGFRVGFIVVLLKHIETNSIYPNLRRFCRHHKKVCLDTEGILHVADIDNKKKTMKTKNK